MDDYSHLRGAQEEGERKSLINKNHTQPEEAKALLENMKKISINIENVPYLSAYHFRVLSHS